MRTIVAIGIAGALGALARYGLDGLVSRRLPSSFPWGTLVVNLSGALVLGFLLQRLLLGDVEPGAYVAAVRVLLSGSA